jgi:YbbR domain-containing protein
MKRILANWELKIVALVIALGLWQYTNGQVRVDRTVRVTVTDAAVQALPAGKYQVTDIKPRELTVRVSTPSSLEGSFRTDGLVPRLVVSADALGSGRQEFPVGNRVLGLKDDIRILDALEPITVTWDEIEEGNLPVELPRIEHLPPGLEATIALDRTRVRVSGAKSQLKLLREQNHRVQFRPVSLEDADPLQAETRVEQLYLANGDPLVRVAEEVKATITLHPKPGSPRTISVPVAILAVPETWERGRVELSQSRVVFTVRGPENLLSALKPETDLNAFVNLRRPPEPNTPTAMPVDMQAPAWLTWDPVTITVTVKP